MTRRRYIILFLAVLLIHLMACNVGAVNDIDDLNRELNNQDTREISGNNLWVDFFKLLLVLAIIIGAAWSLIRLFGKQLSNKMQGTWINVVDEVTLGQNRGIILCEIGEKLYALGITDHNISLLFEVDNPKLLEDISQGTLNLPKTGDSKSLNALKQRIADAFSSNQNEAAEQKEFHSMLEQQLARLRKKKETFKDPSGRSDEDAH